MLTETAIIFNAFERIVDKYHKWDQTYIWFVIYYYNTILTFLLLFNHYKLVMSPIWHPFQIGIDLHEDDWMSEVRGHIVRGHITSC